jgi:hypothetical protein
MRFWQLGVVARMEQRFSASYAKRMKRKAAQYI